MEKTKIKVTLLIDSVVWEKFRLKCIKQNKKFSFAIEELLKEFVKNGKKEVA